ncbi:DUF2523 family protein [Neptunomonas sp.]|uniref:DUF2523 family protein n=1 Tax=Neptunomonas TaxID=75687 RepID=UPI003517E5AB
MIQLFGNIFVRIFGFIIVILVPVLTKIIQLLGIGVVTYLGLDAVTDYLIDNLDSLMSAIPADVVLLMDAFGLTQAAQIYLSAYTALVAYKALTGGNKKWKKPSFKLDA